MKTAKNVLAAALFVTALVSASGAYARGVVVDPDGVSVWSQIAAWFTGGN